MIYMLLHILLKYQMEIYQCLSLSQQRGAQYICSAIGIVACSIEVKSQSCNDTTAVLLGDSFNL